MQERNLYSKVGRKKNKGSQLWRCDRKAEWQKLIITVSRELAKEEGQQWKGREKRGKECFGMCCFCKKVIDNVCGKYVG